MQNAIFLGVYVWLLKKQNKRAILSKHHKLIKCIQTFIIIDFLLAYITFQSACLCVCQSLMVAKAKDDLEQELVDKEAEKERYLAEKAPQIQTSGMSFAELQVCPQLTKLYWY